MLIQGLDLRTQQPAGCVAGANRDRLNFTYYIIRKKGRYSKLTRTIKLSILILNSKNVTKFFHQSLCNVTLQLLSSRNGVGSANFPAVKCGLILGHDLVKGML